MDENTNSPDESTLSVGRGHGPQILTSKGFIPWERFSLDDLPQGIRSEDNLEAIQGVGRRVVQITVRPSDKREDDDPFKKAPSVTGTGYAVWFTEKQVVICTNKHILFNDEEVENSSIDFFNEGKPWQDRIRLPPGNGVCIINSKKKDDFTLALYAFKRKATTQVFERELQNQFPSLLKMIEAKPIQGQKKIVCVVSHPDGEPKHVSFGEILDEDPSTGRIEHNAPTMGGCSGAPIMIFSPLPDDGPINGVWYHTEKIYGTTGVGYRQTNDIDLFVAKDIKKLIEEGIAVDILGGRNSENNSNTIARLECDLFSYLVIASSLSMDTRQVRDVTEINPDQGMEVKLKAKLITVMSSFHLFTGESCDQIDDTFDEFATAISNHLPCSCSVLRARGPDGTDTAMQVFQDPSAIPDDIDSHSLWPWEAENNVDAKSPTRMCLLEEVLLRIEEVFEEIPEKVLLAVDFEKVLTQVENLAILITTPESDVLDAAEEEPVQHMEAPRRKEDMEAGKTSAGRRNFSTMKSEAPQGFDEDATRDTKGSAEKQTSEEEKHQDPTSDVCSQRISRVGETLDIVQSSFPTLLLVDMWGVAHVKKIFTSLSNTLSSKIKEFEIKFREKNCSMLNVEVKESMHKLKRYIHRREFIIRHYLQHDAQSLQSVDEDGSHRKGGKHPVALTSAEEDKAASKCCCRPGIHDVNADMKRLCDDILLLQASENSSDKIYTDTRTRRSNRKNHKAKVFFQRLVMGFACSLHDWAKKSEQSFLSPAPFDLPVDMESQEEIPQKTQDSVQNQTSLTAKFESMEKKMKQSLLELQKAFSILLKGDSSPPDMEFISSVLRVERTSQLAFESHEVAVYNYAVLMSRARETLKQIQALACNGERRRISAEEGAAVEERPEERERNPLSKSLPGRTPSAPLMENDTSANHSSLISPPSPEEAEQLTDYLMKTPEVTLRNADVMIHSHWSEAPVSVRLMVTLAKGRVVRFLMEKALERPKFVDVAALSRHRPHLQVLLHVGMATALVKFLFESDQEDMDTDSEGGEDESSTEGSQDTDVSDEDDDTEMSTDESQDVDVSDEDDDTEMSTDESQDVDIPDEDEENDAIGDAEGADHVEEILNIFQKTHEFTCILGAVQNKPDPFEGH